MTKTVTALTQAEVDQHFEKLQNAADTFFNAINVFKSKYDPSTVELGQLVEQINFTLDDVQEDIDNTFA